MEYIQYVNGIWSPTKNATIPVFDLSVLRGYGVFDYFRTYQRKPFTLSQHVDRLFRSASMVGLEIPKTKEDITQIVKEGIEKNPGTEELDVRIVVTGGVGKNSVTPGTPSLLVLFGTVSSYPNELYERGVSVVTERMVRQFPKAKTINYIMAIPALARAREKQAMEVIYVDKDDHVYEGTTSNIFFIQGGTLITPEEGVLEGITRTLVLSLAEKLKIPVQKESVLYDEMIHSDEIFITASNKEVMPVVIVDGKKIGAGTVGPITKRLQDAYQTLKSNPAYLS